MTLGVCYYPEQWPEERWPTDARLMRAAGISIVRIAEFAWARMEPSGGDFSWGWLDRAIEVLTREGHQIVLGTPTAAPPAWLIKAHPDILPVDAQGRRRRFGSRRHYCPNNIQYHRHCERIVTALAARYGDHPDIIAWQIDNEFGCHGTDRCYCDHCASAFRRWLQERYGSLDCLNETWGTVFWSQTYNDWDQIDPPNLTVASPNPSHVLDYHRFSSDAVVAFQQRQLEVLRKFSPQKLITHNFLAKFDGIDYHDLARKLDFVSWSSYPGGHGEMLRDEFYMADTLRPAFAYDCGDPDITGFCHDAMRGFKQRSFWVMEQQCGQINWGIHNPGIRPGTVRLWIWHAIASGAEAVLFFRWRAGLFGHEQHHAGLLQHDGSFDVGYRDLLEMRNEWDLLEKLSLKPCTAQVAILLDTQTGWALNHQPHTRDFHYLSQAFVYYRALQRLGIPCDILSPAADLSSYKLVVAHTRWLGSEAEARSLTSYIENGGALLLGVRSGFKQPGNLVTSEPLPGVFRDLLGITVTAWHALPPLISYAFEADVPNLTGAASKWAESLELSEGQGAVALARYRSGPFNSQAALTESVVGKGRAYYLGWYPTAEQAVNLLAHIAATVNIERFGDLPVGIHARRRGETILILNFTDEPKMLTHDGKEITLGPRDIQICTKQD